MPKVGNKTYGYTKKGVAAARKEAIKALDPADMEIEYEKCFPSK